MKRSCQRQTQVFDLPVRRMISLVPTPSALNRTISARQTCLCGALRSRASAFKRRRSAGLRVMEIPVRMRQTRMHPVSWESPPGFKCQTRSTSSSVTCHLKVSHSIMAALDAYRPLPIREDCSHPALGVQWDTVDFYFLRRDFDAPFRRHLAAVHFTLCRRHHGERSFDERVRYSVKTDPVACRIILPVRVTQTEQHELFSGIEMERKPIPSRLIRSERLATPLPIHPRLSRDLHRLIVERDDAGRLEIRLAEIVRSLAALRFPAVTRVTLKNERPFGVEPQVIAEVCP